MPEFGLDDGNSGEQIVLERIAEARREDVTRLHPDYLGPELPPEIGELSRLVVLGLRGNPPA